MRRWCAGIGAVVLSLWAGCSRSGPDGARPDDYFLRLVEGAPEAVTQVFAERVADKNFDGRVDALLEATHSDDPEVVTWMLSLCDAMLLLRAEAAEGPRDGGAARERLRARAYELLRHPDDGAAASASSVFVSRGQDGGLLDPQVRQAFERGLRSRDTDTSMSVLAYMTMFPVQMADLATACRQVPTQTLSENTRAFLVSVVSLTSDGEEARSWLLGMLDDEAEDVRIEVVHGLAQHGDARDVPKLLAMLEADGRDDVRLEAAGTLGVLVDDAEQARRCLPLVLARLAAAGDEATYRHRATVAPGRLARLLAPAEVEAVARFYEEGSGLAPHACGAAFFAAAHGDAAARQRAADDLQEYACDTWLQMCPNAILDACLALLACDPPPRFDVGALRATIEALREVENMRRWCDTALTKLPG